MEHDWSGEYEFMGEMLMNGCIKGHAWDENGELLIEWDWPVMKEKYPAVHDALYEIHMEEVADSLNKMVDDGILEREPIVTPEGELDEVYSLTPEGKALADSLGLDLDLDS
jgi:hypothetical protein